MKPIVPNVVLTLLLLGRAPASAATGPPTPAASAIRAASPPLDSAQLARLRAATAWDLGWLAPIRGHRELVDGHHGFPSGYALVRSRRGAPEWQSAIVDWLARGDSAWVTPVPAPRPTRRATASVAPRPAQAALGFMFAPDSSAIDDRELDVLVLLHDRVVQVWTGGRLTRQVAYPAGDTTLIALARAAFPRDSALQRLAAEGVLDVSPARFGAEADPTRTLYPGELAEVDALPELLSSVAPRYPESAGSTLEGTVMVEALVGRDGAVEDARVTRSVARLDPAALEVVRQMRFRPATARGRRIAMWIPVPVTFRLR